MSAGVSGMNTVTGNKFASNGVSSVGNEVINLPVTGMNTRMNTRMNTVTGNKLASNGVHT